MIRSHPSRHRRIRSGGFTLLEALIATALMATILAALATITAQWMPNWSRGLGRIQRDERLALGLGRLVSDLAAAEYIPPGRDTLLPLFDGADRSVTFVRTALAPNALPGLEIVRIAQVQSESGPMLVRTRTPFAPAVEGRRGPLNFSDPVVLLREPYRLSFAYAGKDRIWRNAWQGEKELPRAIKVTLLDRSQAIVASTATLIHTELPARCIRSKSPVDCLSSRQEGDKSAETSKATDPGGTQ